MEILFIITGLIAGFALGWLALAMKKQADIAKSEKRWRDLETEKNNFIAGLDKAKGIAEV